jgi:hypothetical protein
LTESTLLFIPAVTLDLLNEELEQEEEDDEEVEAVAKEFLANKILAYWPVDLAGSCKHH